MLQSIIPLMFLLAIPGIDRRKVILLWPLTHLPDLDYVVGHHRATGHTALILLPILAVMLYHLRPATRDRNRAEWMAIALTYLGSHILMDIFAGGVTLLYPFSTYTVCYYAAIDVVTATNTPVYYLEACSREGIPTVAKIYEWLPANEGALLAFLVPATLLLLAWRRFRRTRRPPA